MSVLAELVDPFNPIQDYPALLKVQCEVGHAHVAKFSPEQGYVAAGFVEGGLAIIDTTCWESVFQYRFHSDCIISVAWSSDARYLVTVGLDWRVVVWDVLERRVDRHYNLSFCPVAASASPENCFKFVVMYDRKVYIADVTNKLDISLLVDLPEEDPFSCIQYMTDLRISVGTEKGRIIFIENGQAVNAQKLCTSRMRAMAYNSLEEELAVAGSDKSVHVFYLANFKDSSEYTVGHRFRDLGLNTNWNALAFSPDGVYLYAASDHREGCVVIWNVHNMTFVHTLRGNKGKIISLDFDPDSVAAIGVTREMGAVCVWRARPPKSWTKMIYDFERILDNEDFVETETSHDIVDRWDVFYQQLDNRKVSDGDAPLPPAEIILTEMT